MSSDPHNQPDKAGLHFEIAAPAQEPHAPGPGSGDDRRADPRAELQLLVEYTRLNKFFADYTENLSHGGTFIRTDDPLPVGTECTFRLTVPRLPDPIVLRGQVMWTKRPGQQPDRLDPGPQGPWTHDRTEQPGMGIRFLYDSPEQRAAISETVEDLMIESLGRNLYNKLTGRAR